MEYKVDGIELRKAMVGKGYNSVLQFANNCEVSRNTMSGIVNGRIRPSSKTIEIIADVLELSSDDIGRIFFSH